jgi:hypothetical protein
VAGLVVALAAVGATVAGLGPLGSSGPDVIGPTTGPVGAEAVFALAASEPGPARWLVNGTEQEGRMVAVTPATAGTVSIEVELDGGSTVLEYRAEPSASALTIEGPGRMAVGDSQQLTARGPADTVFTWEVVAADGSTVADTPGPVLQLTAASEGTVEVTLGAAGQEPVTRTITVAGGAG